MQTEGSRSTELYMSLLGGSQAQAAAAAGEGGASPPFGAVFHILGVPPRVDVNVSTLPFAWKRHFHQTTRRGVFPTLGQLWETRGFSSAIAGQTLHSHTQHGDTCQKPPSDTRGHVEMPGVSGPGTGC